MEAETKDVGQLDLKELAVGDGEWIATFTAILTTSDKDRDGDVLESKGAEIDSRLPLLFNHDTNSPLGRMIEIVDRDSSKIVVKFGIADTALGRDVKKLAQCGCLRMSHGYMAVETSPIKGGGRHIPKFKIFEASVLPVPANAGAEIVEFDQKSLQLETQQVKSWVASHTHGRENTMPQAQQENSGGTATVETKGFTLDDVKKVVGEAIGEYAKANQPEQKGLKPVAGNPSLGDVLGGANGGNGNGDRIDVKKPSARYHTKGLTRVHPVTGFEGIMPSQQENALAGSFLKTLAARSGMFNVSLNEHETQLFDELCVEHEWVGDLNGKAFAGKGAQVKALLADTISGGVNLTPYWFDDKLITWALLSGELLPYVDLRQPSRGNSIHTASIGVPDVHWGSVDGTEMPLFDTDDLIEGIDRDLVTADCVLEVSNDFLADDVVDTGRYLLQQIGQSFAASFDDKIFMGIGTSEPEGITNASTHSVVSLHNIGGPPALEDYEALLFAVPKQYRTNPALYPCFISNDVTYRRSRQLKIDPATPSTDERRLLGMTHNDYVTLGFPHKIAPSALNLYAAFGCLAKYRFWRRLGQEVRYVREDKELARKNLTMLLVRSRVAGQVVVGDAFALCTSMQS